MCRHGGLGLQHRCRVSFPPPASPAPPDLLLSLPAPLSSAWLLDRSATLQTSCCLASHTCPVIHGHGLSQKHLLKVTGWQSSRAGEEWLAVLAFLLRSWLCNGQKRCEMAAKPAQQLLHVV